MQFIAFHVKKNKLLKTKIIDDKTEVNPKFKPMKKNSMHMSNKERRNEVSDYDFQETQWVQDLPKKS